MPDPTPAEAAAVGREAFSVRAALIAQRYGIQEQRAMDILLTADNQGLDTGRPRLLIGPGVASNGITPT